MPSWRALVIASISILGPGAAAAHAIEIHVPANQPTIQAAIVAANPADEVVVAPGTYTETIDLLGKPIVVRSSGGAASTTIDGLGLPGSVIRCVSGEGPATVIEGFTVRNGSGELDGTTRQGLGMFILDSAPTVRACVFADLSAQPFVCDGGAIFCQNGSPLVEACSFLANTGTFGGAILNLDGGEPVILRCLFAGNEADIGDGGAILSTSGKITIEACTFRDNSATFRGGAVKTSTNGIPNAASCIVNCLFTGNSADQGAAIYNHSGHTTITNSTITGNTATTSAAAIHGESAHIANTIIWGNGPVPQLASSIWSIEYSIVQGGYAGPGNLAVDPQFTNPVAEDWTLSLGSPGIDAGASAADIDWVAAGIQPIPALDLAGLPRFADVPSTPDTGTGPAPIVDIGCFERPGAPTFVRGDANVDGLVDIADAIHALSILFGGMGLVPACADSCDANDDGIHDIGDAIYALGSLFSGGPLPPPPHPGCGVDPTPDPLDCASSPACP